MDLPVESEVEFVVRPADFGDLPKLLLLYRDLNPDDPELALHEAESKFGLLLRITGSAIFIGLLDDEIVSTATVVVVPNLTRAGQPYGLIENVVTAKAKRGRGYGRKTLLQAVATAWDHGCYKVMLLTGSSRPETHNFYRSAGFEQNKTGFQMRRIAARRD
ncbi:GCN5-related N-acetyltransferase [Rhizobium sp. PDO1-076]|uniref:GNAT family N-acetyltransferase n=1 Tax=Rhizobium sp. PDO1-076 TaxID=1125979 RepID=UPI00024E340C|nr:GNAT family N-acetyltransferase [Rhizobium sp. PDO1-076]EHS52189.1 GCN5-related N-acetyltransferase [Rhizobium sp. PDO1-076]